MNDFTKEELIDIHEAYTEVFAPHFDMSRMEAAIIEKVKSMIDNYQDPKEIDGYAYNPEVYTECSHDWREMEMQPGVVQTLICLKCRAIHFVRQAK